MRTLIAIALLCAATPAWAHDEAPPEVATDPDLGLFGSFEGHASLFTDAASEPLASITFGYAIKVGYRWEEHWGAFIQAEHNLWMSVELDDDVEAGAFNVGLGLEYRYGNGFVRSSVALGPSFLLYQTLFDEVGQTGLFGDLRPVGLRFEPFKDLLVVFDPLGIALVAPSLNGIPLARVQYRTTLAAEMRF